MIQLGGLEFNTKIAAERYIRALLCRYGRMQTIQEADIPVVKSILELHPNRAVIEDCGIKRVAVQWLDDEGKHRRLVAIRKDSSMRDFTWRHVIRTRSALDSVRRCCRSLVRGQVERFREKAFGTNIALACPVTEERITRNTCDIDHIKPDTFDALVNRWLGSILLKADDIEIIPSPNYQEPDRFQDAFLEENWRQFHSINAKMRAVSPRANRSVLRRAS